MEGNSCFLFCSEFWSSLLVGQKIGDHL